MDNKKCMYWNNEVDRAVVSVVTEKKIQQEYITDYIKEFIDLFGSNPELVSSIISIAITVLAVFISKVLKKVMEIFIEQMKVMEGIRKKLK